MLALHPPTGQEDNALNYTVRESARARRVCLKITRCGQVEVVVPHGFDARRIPPLVRNKQAWIEAVLRRIALRRNAMDSDGTHWGANDTLPDMVTLPAIAEHWQVVYATTDSPRVTITIEGAHNRLTLRGNINDTALCKAALRRWLVRKAQHHFIPWLERLSNEKNLPFNQAQVRSQKTRWGSCSRQKNININCKLLFLPAALVECVLVHELCHTVHMDHSPKFWNLMKKMHPDYAALDKQLRNSRDWMPGWAE